MSQFRHNAMRKRQTPSLDGLSGSLVVSTTPTATALAQDTTAAAISGSVIGVPLALTTPNSSPTSSSTPSATTSSPSSSSGNDISLGVLIGACVGAFILLVLVIYLAIYCTKRQKLNRRGKNAQRRRGSWNRLEDGGDRKGDLPMQRPPSGPMEKLGAMFHRTPSTNSGEKSYDTHGNRESIGTMQHFARYHPGLAEEMASKPDDAGVVVAKPQPVRRLQGRTQADSVPTISWDSETLGGESFLSHPRLSGTMTPTATVAKSTPPATASGSHRWESAEVGHMDWNGSEAGDLRSFADSAASVKSGLSRRVTNPFFNAQEKSQKRTPPANTTPASEPNPFADSNAAVPRPFLDAPLETVSEVSSSPNNIQAMQSLIAALDMRPEDRLRVASMQSSYYSRSSTIMSGDEDIVSVTAFPYPPTQVPL
ncbi:hypothetical protein K503DRAFT_19439 [Rhizopogon vinicolor AM-OR11-026]|uniref:Uncharacterized protein n=1 Tax=Rhizopogon vinicolor AM-OR11-026 TaxID=1314800 RepID=A0A1B7N5P2_9AGAM|nr:hypothetical protein K503DRAFT_19439 [Rhizopogon vinicolor AM-OR11-026]